MKPNPSMQESKPTRDELIEMYLPHVKRIVHRIAVHLPPHVEIDDLIHVGVIGLMQAIDRYDESRENAFMTYAVFRIKGAVLSELRSRDFLTRSNRKKVREMDRAYVHLEQLLGRTPTDDELAESMNTDLEEVHDIKNMSCISFVSYEEMGVSSEEDRRNILNALIHEQADDALTMTRIKELKNGIAGAISMLPEKEKLVISLYYMDELTMKEAGKVLNITESRVSQIHSQAILRLRASLVKQGLI